MDKNEKMIKRAMIALGIISEDNDAGDITIGDAGFYVDYECGGEQKISYLSLPTSYVSKLMDRAYNSSSEVEADF